MLSKDIVSALLSFTGLLLLTSPFLQLASIPLGVAESPNEEAAESDDPHHNERDNNEFHQPVLCGPGIVAPVAPETTGTSARAAVVAGTALVFHFT